MCHNHSNLLCIIETKHGNVFGAYTKQGWNDSDKNGIDDKDAFVSSIRSNRGYAPAIFNAINEGNGGLWKVTWCFN